MIRDGRAAMDRLYAERFSRAAMKGPSHGHDGPRNERERAAYEAAVLAALEKPQESWNGRPIPVHDIGMAAVAEVRR